MSFKVCVSLLIFCLVDLSIVVSGVLKSPIITVLLLISCFILVSIYLTYCGAPMLGAYIFIIVISRKFLKRGSPLYKVKALELQVELGSKSKVYGTQSLPPCE